MFDRSGSPNSALVAALEGADLTSMDSDGKVQFVIDCERAVAWLQALQAKAMVGIVEDSAAWIAAAPWNPAAAYITPISAAGDEVASALDISPRSGSNRVAHAVDLVESMPTTLAALEAGVVSLWQTKQIADELREVPQEVASRLEASVMGRVLAGRLKASGMVRALRREALTMRPSLVKDKHAAALARRGVFFVPLANGMAAIHATMKASYAISLYTTLDRLARETATDGDELERSVDNLRADWLCFLVSPEPTNASSEAGLGETHVCQPEVRVTIDLPTALGLAEHPADLDGVGPIPATLARELATDGKWLRWIKQPQTGALLDAAPQRYTPSDKLVEFIRLRDRICRIPGCSRAAKHCDLDHAVAFDHSHPRRGGQTTRAGTGLLCRRHHLLKTSGGWKLRVRGDGSVEWVSPTGRAYTEPPVDHTGATDPLLMTESISRIEVWLSSHVAIH